MTPQKPIDGTLLAAFTRFQQLSCYWQRQHTTPELAMSEMTEYISLSRSIPELIKRLTAFADVGTSHLFDVAARVKADPPREDAGQGWRELAIGERVQLGDEWRTPNGHEWHPAGSSIGELLMCDKDRMRYRRRIAKDAPKDTAGRIGADLEPPEETGECPTCGGLLERRSASLLCLACGWTADSQGKAPESAKAGDCGASKADAKLDQLAANLDNALREQWPYHDARWQKLIRMGRLTPQSPAKE